MIVMCCSFPVPRSLADTFTIPLASISKVTSICGTPRLAGGIPSRRNCPRDLLSLRELTLALYHVDIHCGLVVCRCGEDLALLGGDRRISLDQSGCDTAHGLDGQRQRGNIQKQDLACARIACQLTALNSRADGHALIRVQRLAGLMTGQLLLPCPEPPGYGWNRLPAVPWPGSAAVSPASCKSCSVPAQRSSLPDRESARQILLLSGSYQNASDHLP